MTEKDLMEALNHVDDELIRESIEATGKRKKKRFRIPSAAAAMVVLVIGAGAALGGSMIIAQSAKIRELENAASVSNLFFAVKNSYEELYEALEEMNDREQVVYEEAMDVVEEAAADGDIPASGITSAPASKEGGDYSKTNLMTEGVDESDIVKTDGKYIYMVQSGTIRITDVQNGTPGESTALMIPFEAPSDLIRELYVDGDRMVVITSHYPSQTYAYSYDISDPRDPKLLGDRVQDGTYNTSRKVGNMVYLFTDRDMRAPDLRKKEAVKDDNLSQWIPSVNGEPVAVDSIYVPEYGRNSLVVSAFDVSEPAETIDAKVILNDYAQIYVGNEHIYLYRSDWNEHQITEITSFTYHNGNIKAVASTTVGGYVRDSFAIHEKNGMLRMLTTDYSGSSNVNTLYILSEDMTLMGRIDEIARGEEIYAARFLGDMAYFITYENHDPLFVADLSDPSDPRLLGSVEISGFSDYLHIWDDTHILGIGYETDENSNRLGMKLVMFDVSDPAAPEIENQYVIRLQDEDEEVYNVWYGSDSVSGIYKAILADPNRNLIGFGYEYSNWKSEKNARRYGVFSYDAKLGFVQRQDIDLEETKKAVLDVRGLYIGDWFYLAGYGDIRTFDMKNSFYELKN